MRKEVYKSGRLEYAVGYPNFTDNTRKHPVIICLHGARSRGRDINRVFEKEYFTLNEDKRDFPFIVIAPLCTEDTWFDLWGELTSLVIKTASTSFVDENRIYLMGNSMGGYAAWQLAMSLPEYFAAVAPICGGGMYWNADRLVNIPIWAFHGANDTSILPEESEKMVEAVRNAGGNVKYTVYPDEGSNCWEKVYNDPELYKWFLSCEKVTPTEEKTA